jgi:hypothetical protein
LVWRTNMGLRGLTSLPIKFTSDAAENEGQNHPKGRVTIREHAQD